MSPPKPRVPPLALAIALSALAYAVSRYHLMPVPSVSLIVVGLVGVLGGGIIFTALIQFRRHKTTAHPLNFANTTVLLASGVFSLSRNPIYLGMLILMLSLALACADLLAFVPGIIFWLWINYWQIAAEENHLQCHFGAAYVEYCKQVRRWL